MGRPATPPLTVPLDPNASEPLYRQLGRALIAAIEAGQFSDNELLPSSRTLAEDLSLSRNTVNLALQQLLGDGYLISVPRVGHVVNPDLQRHLDGGGYRAEEVDWDSRVHSPAKLRHVWKPSDWNEQPFSFVVGQPDIDLFPIKPWNRASRQAMSPEHIRASLQDLVDKDDPLLIDMLRRHVLRSRGINASPDQILITMGSQHGLRLVARALLDDASKVYVEEPGYPDARHIFASSGAVLCPMEVDDQGAIPPQPDEEIDLMFLTPSHQYPTNATLSIGRRQTILNAAVEHDFLVVEDDYDSEFRYLGSATPAMKSMDESGRVIHLGSFSKFLAPGLRIGFIVADAGLIDHLRDLRRYQLRHPPGILQRTLALLIESGDYARSVRRVRNAYKAKWESITDSVEAFLPLSVAPQTGGVTMWIEGPQNLDSVTLAEHAVDRGIVIEPGEACFLADPAPRNYFRLGYSSIPLERIPEGVERLAKVISAL